MSGNYYTQNADAVFDIYESVNPADLYKVWLPTIRGLSGRSVLDIGAGSGRDAAWLRGLGFAVSAAEPNDELRRLAMSRHGAGITWSAASLPCLEGIAVPPGGFDVVFCNGVFMHVRPEDRCHALASIARSLAADGVLFLNFRAVTDQDGGRGMFPIHPDEISGHAITVGLRFECVETRDVLNRSHMSWWSCTLGKMPK